MRIRKKLRRSWGKLVHGFAGRRLKKKYGGGYQDFATDKEVKSYRRRKRVAQVGLVSLPVLVIIGVLVFVFRDKIKAMFTKSV